MVDREKLRADDRRRYKARMKANPNYQKELQRRNRIKKSYGVSLEEYDDKMSTSVICEVCGRDNDLCYDHNHSTGEFRGVLCRACNRSIGQLQDSPSILIKAANYLIERGTYEER